MLADTGIGWSLSSRRTGELCAATWTSSCVTCSRTSAGADPRGLSNQEIAEAIFLSINSVKTYIRTAYREIGVTRRQLAVIWALQHGFTAEIRRAPVPPQLGVPD
jgi:hypothetical protein